MSEEVCGFEKDDGATCEVNFGLCECHGQCYVHSPCRERDRQKSRSRAGHTTARNRKQDGAVLPADAPQAPVTVEEAAQLLAWLSEAVLRGEVDRHTARDCGYLLRAFVNASETDVEDRLESLEGLLEHQREELEALKSRQQMKASS